MTPDFSDLDAGTLPPVDEPKKTFLEAQAEFARLPCSACRGTGQFRSNYTGRLVGECFRCKGTGKVSPRSEKMRATKAANARTRADEKSAWFVAHADVVRWIDDHLPRSSFAASLHTQLATKPLTENQVSAVRKILAEDAARLVANEVAANTNPLNFSGLDLTKIPAGRYAVPNGDTRLKVLIRRPEAPSKWAGWVFVSDAAEYGQQRKYGMQAPGYRYSGAIVPELIVIAKDPKAAAIAYGRLTGTCCICGRKLEDAVSVANGIGPICAGRFE